MRATTKWVAVMTLLPLAAACGAGDGAAGSAVPQDTAAAGTGTTTGTAGETVAPSGAEHMALGGNAISLQQVGGSGVTGQATFSAQGEQTMVMVTLTNAPQGPHAGHIHQGTCESPGQPVVPLQEITVAEANGTGTSHSMVDVPLSTAMNGQHIVAYHERGGDDPGAPIVCGSIPTEQAQPGAAATDTATTSM